MDWFGPAPWSDHGICVDQPAVPIPVGQACPFCKRPMTPQDHGLMIPHLDETWTDQPWHLSCFHEMLGAPWSDIVLLR